ncbi:AAA family ATPase [Methanocorpusculum sp. MG]|uniref:AAA family ATPase n=1 Tax=Methanocorpusculum petauri TaxID=3002863 RepID=A0ABT4IGY7_9EURY|nr:AAA family ATPase [Methanocorpusculum petauri]MCZ0861013.1 AAA family ATPase [Methanocorpusculum petauri]
MTKLEWIEIENFRGISHLKYGPKQINLLIGRNNSGKTSVLDAIYTNLTGKYDPRKEHEKSYRAYDIKIGADFAKISSDIHEDILYKMDKTLPYEIQKEVDSRLYSALQVLYMQMKLPNNTFEEVYSFLLDKLNISVSLHDGEMYIFFDPRELRYSKVDNATYTDLLQNIFDSADSSVNKRKTAQITLSSDDFHQGMDVEKSDNRQNPTKQTILFDESHYRYRRTTYELPFFLADIINQNYDTGHEIVVRVDDLSRVASRKYFENDVRILELETIIKDYNIIPNLERLTGKGVVYKSGNGELTSLPYMMHGAGFFSLLKLIDNMKDAAGGVLLIEEPENNLHPGYLSVFVEQMMVLAKKLNVQVFMTTHSYDLIEELAGYPESEEDQEMIQISRIVNRKGTHELYNYSPQRAFEEMVELKMDLRGT